MGFSTTLLSVLAVGVAGTSALFLPSSSNFTFPTESGVSARGVQGTGQGTFDGFFWQNFVAGSFDVIFTNIAGGQYEVQWDGSGDFVVGQGFNPGSTSRVMTFSASWEPNSASAAILSVYGWSTNPLVEYYINEDANDFNLGTANSGTTHKGTVVSDGSTYDIYTHTQVNQPSIQGTATFQQYLSVRQNKRTSGSVTIQNHVNAWASLGMNLGAMNLQIMAVEGLSSSGQATVTVG
ncbi:concanavalin A-like lectin/glucanase domain-containing protein [Mycena rosella]|uniref:Endo-1,4-beta-xylanase n=1 Tax=Mycena rosella TaxID=1033263 RepID=A0AAD7DXY0_MYCRO|nr:concanavalin A-like lectin/glucanase domain-containing protein [Mycena rosella]